MKNSTKSVVKTKIRRIAKLFKRQKESILYSQIKLSVTFKTFSLSRCAFNKCALEFLSLLIPKQKHSDSHLNCYSRNCTCSPVCFLLVHFSSSINKSSSSRTNLDIKTHTNKKLTSTYTLNIIEN